MFRKLLVKHEGIRLFPYKCSVGKLTIGVGRNIEDIGITRTEAEYLLDNDIERVKGELSAVPIFGTLDNTRQEVLINMCFNMGLPRLMKFKKMWTALAERKYTDAAKEMLDSRWAVQVGSRANDLAQIMLDGAYVMEG